MKMGIHAQQRRYFETDEEFPDNIINILEAYNEASRVSAITARCAAQSGELSDIRRSQWWETVTLTIEQCLVSLRYSNDPFVIPEPPDFYTRNGK